MSKTLKAVMERFRPENWRRVKPVPEEQLVRALASFDDKSPQLAAVVDQLHGQFEVQIRTALNLRESNEVRLRSLDRAAAMLDSIELLETNRIEAKAFVQQEEERKPQKKAA